MMSEPAAPQLLQSAAAGAAPAVDAVNDAPRGRGPSTQSLLVLVSIGLAVLAIAVCGLLWQKLDRIQEELARRSLESGAQALEARTLARQAQESTREFMARQTLMETRISEVSLQRSQLEDLMQTLSRSRDENLVVDIESTLRLAQQQAQLAGSAEPLLAALKSADQRIARAAQPRLNPLQRAITRDLERIKSTTLTDVPALLLKVDELSRMVDDLPLVNAMPPAVPGTAVAGGSPRRAEPANAANRPQTSDRSPGDSGVASPSSWPGVQTAQVWIQRSWSNVQDEARKLLRVSRIDVPEAALLSPEQGFFLRENLKLRLLNARIGLLSRQTETARSDLAAASAWMGKYFEPAARRTQAAMQLVQQVQVQLKTSELPRLDETMAALATAAAGR